MQRPPPLTSAAARWVPPGEEVVVRDVKIPGGMIYVGRSAASGQYRHADSCVIDPRLPVGVLADVSGTTVPYWPAYAGIEPRARRAFLEWLASGRSNPDAYIGYVFIFFYGLERRYFIEGDRRDHQIITDEVNRLLAIYSGNNSFKSYARRFLDVLAVLHATEERPVPSPDLAGGYEMPMAVQKYLGQRLSGMTCWRRLRAWQDAGLWDEIHRHMLERLNLAGEIDWSRASVDASSVPAKRGATRSGRTRQTAASRAPSGTSWSIDRACPSPSSGPAPTAMTAWR